METRVLPERLQWFFSRRADFWLACGGASVGLLSAVLVIYWHGDRELDGLDFVLSEFHLGATYDAIIRRRLWRHRQSDVLLIPLVILMLTYVLSISGQAVLLTSIAMYAAVWHRGRQSLGVARFYQRQMGGPVSEAHKVLFRGAIYLPMLAATLAYTHLAPTKYDGEPYLGLNISAQMTAVIGLAAALCVIAYFAWTLWQTRGEWLIDTSQNVRSPVHSGEWWVVLAHAVAFGSGYVLGASHASFLLVLAVHHEVQYLYFTCALARRSGDFVKAKKMDAGVVTRDRYSQPSYSADSVVRSEIKFVTSYLLWPVIGFVGATVGSWLELKWLAPLGVGGLFCHYWLDARIWTRKSFQD